MENKLRSGLSDHDKMLIKRIDELYAIGSQTLKDEPLIYFEFGILPEPENVNRPELSESRQQVFGSKQKTKSPRE